MAISALGGLAAINSNVNFSGGLAVNESDWEYEYDESETEEYYFTLDLTTCQAQASAGGDQPKRSAQKVTGKASTRHYARGADVGRQGSSTWAPNVGALHVLDLHSQNPLIKVDDALYSGNWSTDLGTQFYIARPGAIEQPLRPGHVLDVVGMARARLVGRPATLRKRKHNAVEELAGSSAANAISVDDDRGVDAAAPVVQDAPVQTKTMAQLAAARDKTSDPAVKAQASFLERLAAIKRGKGEMDTIPIYGVKDYGTAHVDGDHLRRKDNPAGTIGAGSENAAGNDASQSIANADDIVPFTQPLEAQRTLRAVDNEPSTTDGIAFSTTTVKNVTIPEPETTPQSMDVDGAKLSDDEGATRESLDPT